MEPKEAIDTLKALCASVEWDFPLDYAAAIDAAIEALKKQVPMKEKEELDLFGRAITVCGNCGDVLRSGRYCRLCGQRIDV